MGHAGMFDGWGAGCLRRRVAVLFAALAVAMGVVAVAAPDKAHAFAWKDQCVMGIVNDTHSVTALHTGISVLPELPPNPIDLYNWETIAISHVFPPAVGLYTIGFPVPTFGCVIKPVFSWYGKPVVCNVYAPSSGRNVFQCVPNFSPDVTVQILTDNDDIKGAVIFGSLSKPGAIDSLTSPAANPFEPLGGLRASSAAAASPPEPKRVPALLRRRDLPGRGWRAVTKVGQLSWLGQVVGADNLPASCQDAHKSSEPVARSGGASAFTRGSEIVGSEHGLYANAVQARHTLSSAVSIHGIRCLARLLTSARFHTHVKFAPYSLPGLTGATLWRLVVKTRAGARVTRVDYLDVAGLLRDSSNALVLFAGAKKPVRSAIEQSALRTVAGRLS